MLQQPCQGYAETSGTVALSTSLYKARPSSIVSAMLCSDNPLVYDVLGDTASVRRLDSA